MPHQSTTALIHHSYRAPDGFDAPQPGVFKASTVYFPSVAAMRSREWKDKSGYTYGLHGTPTSYVLEARLCQLEGAAQCLLLPSGLAALALVSLSLLQSGDEILLPDNVYGPHKSLLEGELAGWGITHQYYNPMDLNDVRAKLSARTRLLWIEAAGSVTFEFPDVLALVRLGQAHGATVALDNTWGAGLAFAPFDLQPGSAAPVAVDICVHALTKYPSGGGDVLMGSVSTRNEALHLRLKLTHMRLGFGVGANDVELVLRSLPSMALRYRAQASAAHALALWCKQQPAFAQVLHPALEDAPGHIHWKTLCKDGLAAGLFSVVIDARYSPAAVDAFCDALRLFRLGYSWGGPVSLVVPYDLHSMRSTWPATIRRGTVVRLAIGLEDVADLQADLMSALHVLDASAAAV